MLLFFHALLVAGMAGAEELAWVRILSGGGSAYGAMTLPILGGHRAALDFEVCANKASIGYRDDASRDLPLVFSVSSEKLL
jgi:hypothetical protein